MASINDVSQGIVERLKPVLPDWEHFWYEPARIPAPAFCVRPDPARHADYQHVFGGYTKWFLRVGLYMSTNDLDASRLVMGPLIASKGLIIAALTDDAITDDLLYMVCRHDVRPTDGRGWDVMRRNLARYLYADIGFELGSN